MNQLVQSLHRASGVLDNGRDVRDQRCNGFLDHHSEAALGLANLGSLPSSELYKRIQHGADIPILGLQRPALEKTSSFRHQTSDVIRKSLPSEESSEDGATRRRKLEDLIEVARRQHRKLEAERNESRKHHDFFTPAQKLPISPTRYENVEVSPHHSSSSPQLRNSPALSDDTLASQSLSLDRLRGLQVQGKARALYSFSSQSPREMSFGKGDILYLLHQVDRNWFLAERNGQVGIIPANYIQVLPPGEGWNTPAVDTAGQARAKFSFCGETSAELSLIKGEFVSLLRRIDENWFEGHTRGRQGIFPASYVSVIREASSSSMITTPIPGSPEMLSPISWKTSTPPLYPSPTTFNQSPPGTYPWGHRPPTRLPAGSQSSDELLWPELTVFGQKRVPSLHRRNEELDFSLDSCKSAELGDAGVSFDHSSSASGSVKKSWSQVSDEDCFIQRYKALIDYTPLSEDELELKEGDEVWVLDQSDDGWFLGTSTRTGQSGVLPGHYVQKSWEATASH